MNHKKNDILKRITLDNKEIIGYRESGVGDINILLIHGNMTSSKHWDIFIEKLPIHYKVYAIDLRGFGISSYMNPINSLKNFSDDIMLFLKHFDINEVIVTGWSTGGGVAMQLAADYPDIVKKLILIDSIGIKGYTLLKIGNNEKEYYLKTREDIANDDVISSIQNAIESKDKQFLMRLWDTVIYTHNQPSPSKYEEYIDDILTQRNLIDVYYALSRFNISHENNGIIKGTREVKNIVAPTLVIHGDRDMVITKETADEIVEGIGGNAKLIILENSGHSPFIDSLDELLFVYQKFIT